MAIKERALCQDKERRDQWDKLIKCMNRKINGKDAKVAPSGAEKILNEYFAHAMAGDFSMNKLYIILFAVYFAGIGIAIADDEYPIIEQGISLFCDGTGHPADHVSVYNSLCQKQVECEVFIFDTDLLASGNAKSVSDLVMWFCTGYEEISAVRVSICCDEEKYGQMCEYPRARSMWSRDRGQYL